MEKKNLIHPKKFINKVNVTIFLAFFVFLALVFILATPSKYTGLKVYVALFMALASSGAFYYILKNITISPNMSFWAKYKYELLIIIALFIVYLPLLIKGYYYYDDLWMFGSFDRTTDIIVLHMATLRPIGAVLGQIFVGNMNTVLIRWISWLFMLFFAFVLHTWLREKTKKEFLAFVITMAICVSSAYVDVIGYAATQPFSIALAWSGFAVILFEKSMDRFRSKRIGQALLMFCMTAVCLVTAFYAYQLATAIVFLMFAISIIFEPKRKYQWRNVLLFIVLLGICGVLYLKSSQLLCAYYNIEIGARAVLGNPLLQIVSKLQFFFDTVLKQSLFQIIASIFGGGMFHEIGRINVFLTPMDQRAVLILSIILCVFVIFAIVMYAVRTKKIVNTILLVLFLFFSHYTLFVLNESSYVSYYVIPFVSYLLFLLIMGIYYLLGIINKLVVAENNDSHFRIQYILLIPLCAMMLNAYIYVSNFWVGLNTEIHDYMKHTVQSQYQEKRWLHTYGVPQPGQGNEYSVFAESLILKEMGLDPANYIRTASDNKWYISVVPAPEFERLMGVLDEEEQQFMLETYKYDEIYGRWYINITEPSMETLETLREIFIKGKMIPGDEEKEALYIDLTWTADAWYQ